MTQFLPPNLLALFAARDPIPFKTPAAQLSWEKDRARNPYTGVSSLTPLFEDPKDTPPPTRGETKSEKKFRRIKEKAILRAKEVEEEAKNYDPHNNREATGDAFKTLFISRINYDTSESKLRREFDMYGPIRKINMVKDSSGKPRGYAFIEFEHERDMHTAYKNADGKKIDGRRVLVDVERGRTVKGWRPRRLGGGLGSTRQGANEENVRQSGRDTGRPERGDEKRDMARSDSRDRRRSSRDRDRRDSRRDRDRDRDRGDRKRDRGDRDRDRDRDRRDKDRDEPSKDKGRDRDRADRKHRNRDRSKERDRDGSRRKRSRDRDRKDRDRSDRDKDKDRRSRPDKDRRDDDDSKREPKSEYPNEEVKREGSNGDVDQKPSYDDTDTAPVDGMKQEQEYQEPNGEKGQGDYQNSDGMRGSPSGSADMEY